MKTRVAILCVLILTSCAAAFANRHNLTAQASDSLSATSLNFGNQTVGTTSASQTVTLSNSGKVTLSISAISISGNFSQSNNCGSSLASGSSCSIVVLFDALTAGTNNGTLTINDNATSGAQTVALTGTGISATHSVTVGWTPSSSSGVTGYNVYRSTTSGSGYSMLNTAPITSTSFTDTTVGSGHTYYYVATAMDTTGMQSSDSNQVSAVVP
jgi:centrosomal CEP192-like protein